jgi:hypothetical protein
MGLMMKKMYHSSDLNGPESFVEDVDSREVFEADDKCLAIVLWELDRPETAIRIDRNTIDRPRLTKTDRKEFVKFLRSRGPKLHSSPEEYADHRVLRYRDDKGRTQAISEMFADAIVYKVRK